MWRARRAPISTLAGVGMINTFVRRFGSGSSASTRSITACARWCRSRSAAASPSGACRVACSTTSTAAPRTSARWRRNAAAFGRHRRSGPGCCATSATRRPVDHAARPAARRAARARARPGSPASPIPRASWPSPARPSAAGLPYTLSTLSTRSIEEVAAVSDGRLVVPGVRVARPRPGEGDGRPGRGGRLRGARAHGRHRGARPPRARRPARVLAAAEDRPRTRSSTARSTRAGRGTSCAPSRSVRQRRRARRRRRRRARRSRSPTTSTRQFDPALSWADVDWLRSVWDGPIVLKGIQTVADACSPSTPASRRIALSNHGGRQLDDAPAPIDLVAPVRRRGRRPGRRSSATAACAAAATSSRPSRSAPTRVSIGRAYLYGLGAAGERGVDHVLEVLQEGFVRTMALTGCRTVAEIDRDLVHWRS